MPLSSFVRVAWLQNIAQTIGNEARGRIIGIEDVGRKFVNRIARTHNQSVPEYVIINNNDVAFTRLRATRKILPGDGNPLRNMSHTEAAALMCASCDHFFSAFPITERPFAFSGVDSNKDTGKAPSVENLAKHLGDPKMSRVGTPFLFECRQVSKAHRHPNPVKAISHQVCVISNESIFECRNDWTSGKYLFDPMDEQAMIALRRFQIMPKQRGASNTQLV